MGNTQQGHEILTNLTTDIVISHLSHNRLGADELPGLIQRVYDTLAGLSAPTTEEAPLTPAVSIRSSVKPDHVTCLECGKQLSLLKRHLATDHGLSPGDYRHRWGLSSAYPLIAPDYAARRADLARQIGLGRRRKGGGRPVPAPAEPEVRVEAKATPDTSAQDAAGTT